MPNLDYITVEVARRTMTLFFVIDTSSSMKKDKKIDVVNETIKDTIPLLKNIANADAKVKVAVLDFASGAEWQTPKPIDVEDFVWRDLSADDLTDLGEACDMLNEKLSKKAFMGDATCCYAPVIMLLSDGFPTDNYKKGIGLLKNNNWFKNSIRIAVAIGSHLDTSVLEDFTGFNETVLHANNASALRKIIRCVSVRASQVASTSCVVCDDAETSEDISLKQKAVIDELASIEIDSVIDDDTEW